MLAYRISKQKYVASALQGEGAARALGLLVPSAVARGESNILVNPEHADFAAIELVSNAALELDPRLFG